VSGSPQQLNKRIVVRFIEELLNEGRLEVADELVAEDFKAH
jgi:predicted SnoaL-like aldol condensation-catalyzing enzyme